MCPLPADAASDVQEIELRRSYVSSEDACSQPGMLGGFTYLMYHDNTKTLPAPTALPPTTILVPSASG